MADERKAEIVCNTCYQAALTMTGSVGKDESAKIVEILRAQAPDAGTLALTLTKVAARMPGKWFPHMNAIISSYLQVQLTAEHVAAQEKMSRAADRLVSACWGLAAIGLLLAIATYWKTFGPLGLPR